MHLSRVFKARDVMMSIHWDMANHFLHQLEPDIFTLGFDASRDREATRQEFFSFGQDFTFDVEAKRKCHEGLAEKIPRRLYDAGNSLPFRQLLNEIGNHTPATEEMIRNALQPAMSSRDIQVFGANGERRQKATTIRASDTILPTGQGRLVF